MFSFFNSILYAKFLQFKFLNIIITLFISAFRFLLDTSRIGTISSLQKMAETARLVCCTALTASRHSLLNIDFDWCIVDEAGQINQPTILGPIMKAKRWIYKIRIHTEFYVYISNQRIDCRIINRIDRQSLLSKRNRSRECYCDASI